MRYAEVSQKEVKFLDVTSLTVEEFCQLQPAFEEAFQERMKEWCLDGKKRTGRGYLTYANCPLPTPEDRLLFILVYLKNNSLQVLHGELFAMPQNKANQWIHTLFPVLQTALKTLGDRPARSMEQLAQRLGYHTLPDTSTVMSEASALDTKQEKHDRADPPLFAMMGPNDASSVPKIRMNRKAILAARKNAIA
jgi:Helix-turn-helix of DDE superfamily endonuclease